MGRNNITEAETLAVKYRPRVLADLYGQDAVVAQIEGMLNKKKFPSTLLLNGESGSGKTTTARIIARYINCLNPDKKDHTPCGECASCKYGEKHPDVHEINMADNRGIDDVRALINSARNMPTLGQKRIFIIDEVHAATPQAFQAFLKPLEEPPKNTIWILATTNPEKIPATVLGRCYKFQINSIPEDIIVKRLSVIAKKEGVSFKTDVKDGKRVLQEIANMANGRLRDSISMLESVLYAIASGKKFTADQLITNFAKTVDADLELIAANLAAAVINGSGKVAVQAILKANNARGVVNKTRWLCHALIQESVGEKFWRTNSYKAFDSIKRKNNISVQLSRLLLTQDLFCSIEEQFNRLPIDENVLFMSRVGAFIVNNPVKKEK